MEFFPTARAIGWHEFTRVLGGEVAGYAGLAWICESCRYELPM